MSVRSLEDVAHVSVLRGSLAGPETVPRVLVEVPHGACRRAHYDACREQLVGTFPDRLEHFFHANTDEGAWELGLATARQVLVQCPDAAVQLIRCLVPRTFIDCNRVIDADPDLAGGGVTAGLHVYVEEAQDRTHLLALHRAYCDLVDRAMARVVAADGLVLVPHSYAPRTVGIARVEHDIVEQLHRVWAPDQVETWPLRAEVDLITRDGDGARLCPDGAVEALVPALAGAGLTAVECGTYWLHPATRAAVLSARYPKRLLCLEVRRDLLMDGWRPFEQSEPNRPLIDRVGRVIAEVIAARLG